MSDRLTAAIEAAMSPAYDPAEAADIAECVAAAVRALLDSAEVSEVVIEAVRLPGYARVALAALRAHLTGEPTVPAFTEAAGA